MIPILIMVALVILSAYFSATETAFSTVNKTKLKTLAEKDNRKAKLVLSLSENYDKLISTILIGNNIVNIALSSIATVYFIEVMAGHTAAPTVSTVVTTVVVLIFGEITPKSLAKDFPEKFAMFSAPIIRVLIYVLLPLNIIFSGWKKLLSKVIKKNEEEDKMSQEELLMLVEEVEQEGTIDKNESNLLRNAIEFTERRADDILTHRMDLEAVAIDDTIEEIAETFANSRFSRLLVYRDSIDTIVGMIHQKDFFGKDGITTRDITEIMTPVVYVQHGERINDLLMSLQKNKTHIAVVLDEYGGTLGIVTMEDILEELVGEIWDEHDEVEEVIQEIGEDTYLVDCSINLDDLSDRFDLDLESESGTFASYVMEKFGGLPEEGENFTDENMSITVREMDVQRIIKAEVTVFHKSDEEEENAEENEAAEEQTNE
ncbi:MAG: HlyC/CorC family transporter [Clostridia bacterium]|nr:HlyC/CorC family transporter [Clostridia bacterium]